MIEVGKDYIWDDCGEKVQVLHRDVNSDGVTVYACKRYFNNSLLWLSEEDLNIVNKKFPIFREIFYDDWSYTGSEFYTGLYISKKEVIDFLFNHIVNDYIISKSTSFKGGYQINTQEGSVILLRYPVEGEFIDQYDYSGLQLTNIVIDRDVPLGGEFLSHMASRLRDVEDVYAKMVVV